MPGVVSEQHPTVDLELFWQLASSSKDVRHEAAKKLAQHLGTAAAESESEGPSVDLQYSLKRLIRGLASSRDGAREGFCLALVQLLRTRPEIDGLECFALAKELLQVPKGGTSQEEKECHFGRLFGCSALVQAGRCALSETDATMALKNGSHEELLNWKIMEELIRLQNKKSYLAEGCCATIAQALAPVPEALLKHVFAPRLLKLWEGVELEAMSPEQLDLMLRMELHYGSMVRSEPLAAPVTPGTAAVT